MSCRTPSDACCVWRPQGIDSEKSPVSKTPLPRLPPSLEGGATAGRFPIGDLPSVAEDGALDHVSDHTCERQPPTSPKWMTFTAHSPKPEHHGFRTGPPTILFSNWLQIHRGHSPTVLASTFLVCCLFPFFRLVLIEHLSTPVHHFSREVLGQDFEPGYLEATSRRIIDKAPLKNRPGECSCGCLWRSVAEPLPALP